MPVTDPVTDATTCEGCGEPETATAAIVTAEAEEAEEEIEGACPLLLAVPPPFKASPELGELLFGVKPLMGVDEATTEAAGTGFNTEVTMEVEAVAADGLGGMLLCTTLLLTLLRALVVLAVVVAFDVTVTVVVTVAVIVVVGNCCEAEDALLLEVD